LTSGSTKHAGYRLAGVVFACDPIRDDWQPVLPPLSIGTGMKEDADEIDRRKNAGNSPYKKP